MKKSLYAAAYNQINTICKFLLLHGRLGLSQNIVVVNAGKSLLSAALSYLQSMVIVLSSKLQPWL